MDSAVNDLENKVSNSVNDLKAYAKQELEAVYSNKMVDDHVSVKLLIRRAYPEWTHVEHTFLRADAIASVADLGQPEQQLCGVIRHCTQLKEPVLATIAGRGKDRTLLVYVGDIEENLLGPDHLQESEAILKFGDMTMEVVNWKEPLLKESSVV
ncbi:hypothetical protein E2C01_036158 [Portunus trituberculatus]|uniref:Uncharacterized protein n=1 Tax=Portunus trituberculatus TaxID=210409 RepID=A0A5B7FAK4_PORTR|nr:hypothetical protein [Portunus trituberculatus]